jgi:hypothetical protein
MNITCDIIIELHKKHENSEWCLTPFQIDELINKSRFFGKKTIWNQVEIMGKQNEILYECLFGLKSGIIFTKTGIYFLNKTNSGFLKHVTYDEFDMDWWSRGHMNYLPDFVYENKTDLFDLSHTHPLDEKVFFKSLKSFTLKKEKREKEQRLLQKEKRLKTFKVSKSNILSELDKDGNGKVDVIEGDDFNLLLKKHQKSIVEIDRIYVQQFVKVSSYLKTKEKNIQSIFNLIKKTPNQKWLNECVEILKGDIHSYNLILFNSLNMIVSLVEDEMITFYEIHEQFDTLNMFDSKHEKDISQKLSNIGDGLKNLIYEIREMSDSINNSIGELSYVTEESNKQLEEQLSEINSSLGVNNLLTGIQTYQMYKINKNTK